MKDRKGLLHISNDAFQTRKQRFIFLLTLGYTIQKQNKLEGEKKLMRKRKVTMNMFMKFS